MTDRAPLALLCALCLVLVACYADRPVLIVTGADGGTGATNTATGAAGGGAAGPSGSGTAGASGGGTAGASGGHTGTGGAPGCDAASIFVNPNHNCTLAGACHDAMGSAANFDMVTPGWEKRMVGGMPQGGGVEPSICFGKGLVYLVPGSQPATGLFLEKLFDNPPPCGAHEPILGIPLSASESACVQSWANALTAAP